MMNLSYPLKKIFPLERPELLTPVEISNNSSGQTESLK